MTEHSFDIVALGEALIDMSPVIHGGQRAFVPNPGGAPLNLLSMASKLGLKAAFIGKVGRDAFGKVIRETLREEGIDSKGLLVSDEFPTTLAFVHLDDAGDRSFTFYRKGAADVNLREDEIRYSLIDRCRVFHFGSLSLTGEPVKTATMEAVKHAREKQKIISYDPNYRPLLWPSLETAREVMSELLPFVDILKVSEEECEILTGSNDPADGMEKLSKMGPELILMTFGDKGASYRFHENTGHAGAAKIRAVDTTGCGDAFFGAFLSELVKSGEKLDELQDAEILKMLQFAVSTGTLTALKPGGIPSLPEERDILTFMT